MTRTRIVAAVLAVTGGVMSAAVAHAVGGPDTHGQSGTTHGQGRESTPGQHGNTGTTHGQSGTHGPKGNQHSPTNSHARGCRYRSVAWVAKGILQPPAP